ncbi:MAG: helix-turn-helix transcriptional regulator [Ruminococcus sp.]|nr:helix-turn-helix transcriptional regulator [Ruminococcus sp.]
MDLNKIGKFISEERKKKNYTQKQLAEILNISDRTISKWECGKGLPDVSLLQPLCKELGISVNELLTGERLDQENYMEKAEQKILHLVEEKKENRTKLILILVMGLISIISFVTLIGVVDAYGEIISAQAKDLLVFIACAVFSVGLLALVEGVRRFGYYKCLHCGETFVPGFINYTAGINIVVVRFMRCPHCGKWRWCLKVLTKKERDESERT